ncbi:hypothetical protein BJF90_45590 [Pseudonocardia sp. CNS-004]|nr:hypothetical protein BJF90_45590 [Pseudonocardia sp. CNS-004]
MYARASCDCEDEDLFELEIVLDEAQPPVRPWVQVPGEVSLAGSRANRRVSFTTTAGRAQVLPGELGECRAWRH